MLIYSMTKRTTPIPSAPKTKKDLVTTRFKTTIRPPRQFFRQWRKYRTLTLEKAAGEAGMTAGNLSAMERGEQGYTPAGLQALADVYRTSPGWLLEVNPLDDDGSGMMDIWQKAGKAEKQMILDIAKQVVKSR